MRFGHDMTTETAPNPTGKSHGKQSGITFWEDDGSSHYIEYCNPFSVSHYLATSHVAEMIVFRTGESQATMKGHDLYELAEDLRRKKYDAIKPTEKGTEPKSGEPYIESIVVRCWF